MVLSAPMTFCRRPRRGLQRNECYQQYQWTLRPFWAYVKREQNVNTAWRNFAARSPAHKRDLFGRAKRDNNSEAREQAAMVEYVRWVKPEILIFHVANGGLRSKTEAARLKWMGVLAGVPDLILILPKGRCAFWEVKWKGELSPEQRDFIKRLTELGHSWAVVRSIDDARRELAALGIETKEARR
jgi:hypothetical protein